jgi:hypothetical protein
MDEPLLSPKRLLNAVRWWWYFLKAGMDMGFWHTLRFYRREAVRVRAEGEDYRPAKYVWHGPDANLLR